MGKRELVALFNLSSWCLVMVEWLFLALPWGCLRFVIMIFPDHTHLLFLLFAFDTCTLYISLKGAGQSDILASMKKIRLLLKPRA